MAARCRVVPRDGVRDRLGEGLYWSSRDRAIYWTDIVAPALNRLSLVDGRVDRWAMPDLIGWVIEREHDAGWIAGFRTGFAVLRLDPLRIDHIADPEPDRPGNRLNDAKADRWGRIWAGTMAMTADRPDGALYRFDPDGRAQRMDDGYTVANGPAFSPDGRWLYHTDTRRRTIYRFACHDDGTLADKRAHIVFEDGWGNPDGMTVDEGGFLWVASWGGARVLRFDADGRLDRWIELPTPRITNVCFGGEGLDRLLVTSASIGGEDDGVAGALFELEVGVRGLPPYRYGG